MTLQEAKEFLKEEIDYLGSAFHPDTDFNDYIDLRNGEKLYSPEQAQIHNEKMKQAFDAFDSADQDIYDYCIELINN